MQSIRHGLAQGQRLGWQGQAGQCVEVRRGRVEVEAAEVEQLGVISADGQGEGGSVDIAFSDSYRDISSSITSVHTSTTHRSTP